MRKFIYIKRKKNKIRRWEKWEDKNERKNYYGWRQVESREMKWKFWEREGKRGNIKWMNENWNWWIVDQKVGLKLAWLVD